MSGYAINNAKQRIVQLHCKENARSGMSGYTLNNTKQRIVQLHCKENARSGMSGYAINNAKQRIVQLHCKLNIARLSCVRNMFRKSPSASLISREKEKCQDHMKLSENNIS
jgi:hypothetical protein